MPNAKFGVDISSFKSGIASAKNEVKTLDQQMKMLDATMKAEGKSEQTLSAQTQTLNNKLTAQKSIANQAEAALKAMTDNGVDPASDAYQKMARELLAAQTGMMDTKSALNELGEGAVAAADGAERLETGLKGITKKISLEQVISGIDKISNGLKNAAGHAISLGESLFDAVMDKARLADDNATMALMYGIDLDRYLKMQGLVASGMDTSVDAILKAQTKMNKGIGDSKAQEVLKELKVSVSELQDTGDGIIEFVRKDPEKLFWDIGNAIMNMGDAFDKESAAQSVFGRSWKELVPLFKDYHSLEEFNAALDQVQVISEEDNKSLVEMADSFDQLHQKMDTLTTSILAQFAPGLTDLADSLSGVLSEVNAYLQTPEGKEALAGMSESIQGLFSSLKDLSAEDIVSKFSTVLDSVVGGLGWLKDNGDTVIKIIEGLGIAWAGLKVSSGALTILQVINGLKDLAGFGAAGAAASAASGAGGGTLATTLSTLLTTGATKVAGVLGSATLQNAVPGVFDWFTNTTHLGRWMTGTEKPQEYFDEVKKNAETFEEDWRNNVLTKPFVELGENSIKFWDKFWKGATEHPQIEITEEDLIPMDEQTLQLKLMEQIREGGVQIPIEPEAPEGSAESIAAQIGTVSVPVVLVPTMGETAYTKRTPGMMGTIPGHANGLPFVPYDGYLAVLHQGERIMTATENRHYTYNSHNYFGNVNLNNGQDIENLCDRIDVHNQRMAAGYGG